MDKKEIRAHYKNQRLELNKLTISYLSKKIFNLLQSNFLFDQKIVHSFYSIPNQNEIEMNTINKYLLSVSNKLATSITKLSPLRLIHSEINENTIFYKDKYNIPIPKTIIPLEVKNLDFVLIPLLAFDIKGNRIGYGKGLYDSFLNECRTDCIKIGLSFFEHHENIIQSEPHDVKLDYCVTPNKVYNFNEF